MRVAIVVRAIPVFCVDFPIRKNITTNKKPIVAAMGNHDACIVCWRLKDVGLIIIPRIVAVR